MGKDIQKELLSKVNELASLSTLTAEELTQKQAKIEQLQKTVEQLQSEIVKLKGDKNERQPNKEDINKILNKIKSVDRDMAKSILLDTKASRELCFGILDYLNIKASSRAKKETLVEKILDTLFNYENQEYYYEIATQLKNVKTREEARNILKNLKLDELKKLKRIMKISAIGKTKQDIILYIVQSVIGDRLDTEAIMNVKLK